MPLDLSGLTPLDTTGLKPAGGLDLSGLTPLDTTGLDPMDAEPAPEVSPDDAMTRGGEGLAPPTPTVLPRPGEAEDSWSALGSRIIENVPRVFQMVGAGAARAVIEAAPSPGGTAGMALDQETLDDLARVQRERVDARGGPDDWARRVAEDAAAELQANAPNVDPDTLKGYAYDFAVSMAQMAPAVAATIATRSPSVGAATIGAQVFGQQYADSRAKGRSHEAAIADGTFMAAAEAIPESIPLGVLARPGKTFLTRLFKGTVAEGMQEPLTTALQDGYSAGVLDEDMTWGEALANMQRAGILGAAMGGSFAVATEPFVRGQRGADQPVAAPGAMPPVPPRATGGAPPEAPAAAPAPRPSLLTPDDRASPLPDAVIDEGKQIIEDALAGRPIDVPGPQAEKSARSGLDTAPAPTEQQLTATESPGPEWRPLYSDATRSEQIGWTNPATGEARMIEMPQPAGQGPVAEQAGAAPAVSDPADQASPAADVDPNGPQMGPEGTTSRIAEPQQDQQVAADQQQASAPLDTAGLAPVEVTSTVSRASPAIDAERAAAVDQQAEQIAEPTEAQKEAGNYRKGHTRFAGLDITVETGKGQERSGTDPDGKPWSVTVPAHYGYIRRTEGADGDHVDVYLGDGPETSPVWVVDQVDADSRKFDEHKVMLGVPSRLAAEAIYLRAFSDGRGRARLGTIRQMSMDEFKAWLRDGDQTKPAADQRASSPEVGSAFTLRKRPARPRTAPVPLLQFIRDQGGIDPADPAVGDLRATLDKATFRVLGRPATARTGKGGRGMDYMREAAVEAGYLPEGATIADFLDAIQKDAFAQQEGQPRVVTDYDIGQAVEMEQRQREQRETDRAIGRFGNMDLAAEYEGTRAELQVAIERGLAQIEELNAEIDRLTREVLNDEWSPAERPDDAEIPFDFRTDSAAAPEGEPVLEAAPRAAAEPAREGVETGERGEAGRGDRARGDGRGGDRADAGGVEPGRVEARPEPRTERTDQGDQILVPGVQPVSDRERAEAKGSRKLRSDKPQKPADDGIFDVAGRGQGDLLSQPPAAPPRVEDARPTSATPDPKGYVDHWQEVADLLHGVEGMDARVAVADAWVLEKGLATGHEYLVVLDGEGRLIQAGTIRANDFVAFDGATQDRRGNRAARMYGTHNHPSGRSFSLADVKVAMSPGFARVRAVTDSVTYTVTATDAAKAPGADAGHFADRLYNLLYSRTLDAVKSGRLSADDTTRGHPHAFAVLLHRLGLITYETTLDGDPLAAAHREVLDKLMPMARVIVRPIANRVERADDYLPDRLSAPVRSGGRVGRVRGVDAEAAAGRPGREGRTGTRGEVPARGRGRRPKGLSEDRQTDTPAFRRWFGDSKVVDENGEPLVVYHGSISDFEEFRPTPSLRRDGPSTFEVTSPAYFFSADPDTAGMFAGDRSEIDRRLRGGTGGQPMTRAFHLSIENPLDFTVDDATAEQMVEDGYSPALAYSSRAMNPYALEAIENLTGYTVEGWQDLQRLLDDPDVVGRLREDGYDGARVLEDDGSEAWAAFEPTQIKSATGNRGTFDPDDPSILREDAPRFDLAREERRAVSRLTPQDRALIDRHLAPLGGGRISRIAKALFARDRAWGQVADAAVSEVVNDLNAIFAYEMRAEEAAGRTRAIRDASVSAAKMAEFAMNDTGRTWAMLHVGPLRYNAADGIIEAVEGRSGFYDIFKYLSDPATYDKFRLYAAARRGQRLMSEGRERNLTPEAIERGVAMADDVGAHKGETRTFREIFDDYQAFNAALLKGMGVDTGLMSQEDVDFYTEHMDYTPFYREADETTEPLSGPWLRKRINKPDPGIKALEGGQQRIGDLMENIARNAMAITRAGMRNVTMRRIYELAETLGEGQIVRDGSVEDGVLTYRVSGRDVKFTVDDPALVVAVAAMKPDQFDAIQRAGAAMASFFRNGITAAPAFMLKNLIRGTTAGFVQTGKNISLANNAATGLVRALRNDTSIRELRTISGTGAYNFGGAAGNLGAQMRRMTGAQREPMPIAVVRKMWGVLERFGEATELADRDAIYNNLIREGKSKAEAAYQAMNLINYSRRGSNKTLRYWLPMLPFLNARIQGLYRMAETQTTGPERTKALMGVAARGLVLTGVSMALYALQGDDDRYDDEPLHRKLAYYIVYAGDTRILIPKAFEFGAIFSTLPELMVDAVAQKEGKRLAEGLAQTMLNTFAFNPIPQPALPILENIANYNFFTGREIENDRLQNLPAGMRYNAATPRVLREIGRQFDVSPAKMENLIRGYTGTMGMSLLAGLDSIGRAAGAFPSEPTGPFGDFGIFSDALEDQIGSMVRVGPDRSNRWIGDLYEMSRDVNQAYRQARQMAAEGDVEAARRLAAEEGAGARKFLNKQTRALGDINKIIRQVEDDPTMTRLAKRAELNRLNEARNRIAETAVKAVRAKVPALD